MSNVFRVRQSLAEGKSIYDIPLRVVYYARVSTESDEQKNSLENQNTYYGNMIRANANWSFCGGYSDEGISGTSVKKRKMFMKMASDAENNMFDLIITKEISRFSRNTCDSISYSERFLSYGVGVLFQSDNICTFCPDAELRLAIMSSIAQDEVRKISERVRFGLKRAVEKGVVLGNGNIFGYDKRAGALYINEEQCETVKRIFDLYAFRDFGIRRIAQAISDEGIPMSFSTVKSILTNPVYAGVYCGGKSVKPDYRLTKREKLPMSEWTMKEGLGAVPPIISKELFEKAMSVYSKRSSQYRSEVRAGEYVYSGTVVCEKHCSPYYRTLYRYADKNREAWQCREYASKGKSGCDSPAVFTDELDDVCRALIAKAGITPDDICDKVTELISSVTARRVKRRPDTDAMRERLIKLYISGFIDDTELERRKEELAPSADSQSEESVPARSDVLPFCTRVNVTKRLAGELLKKITVSGTRREPRLKAETVFGTLDYVLTRKRGRETSVCCKQDI